MKKSLLILIFMAFLSISVYSENQLNALKKINQIFKTSIEKIKSKNKKSTEKTVPIKVIGNSNQVNSQVQPFIDIGLIQLDLNNLEEAQTQFEKALKLRPDIPEIYYYLAKVYEKKYQYDISVEYYKKAIEKKPDYELAKKDVTKLLNTLEKQLKNEIKMDPSFPDSYIQLGYVYMQKKNYESALKVLSKAISLNTKNPICYDYLSILSYKTGNIKKAYQYIEKAFQIAPNNEIIYQHYKSLSEQILKQNITYKDKIEKSSNSGESNVLVEAFRDFIVKL